MGYTYPRAFLGRNKSTLNFQKKKPVDVFRLSNTLRVWKVIGFALLRALIG